MFVSLKTLREQNHIYT